MSARSLEIAPLRAIGFGASGIVLSVFAEAIALSLARGSIGALLAWLLYNGKAVDTKGRPVYSTGLPHRCDADRGGAGYGGGFADRSGGRTVAGHPGGEAAGRDGTERWSESVPTLTRAGQAQDDTDDRGRRACDDLIE